MTNKFRNKKFKFLYKFHIYGGLFSAAFFIIIGISSLSYNHPNLFKKENFKEKIYYQSFSFKSDKRDLIIENAIDSLNIFGHLPKWLQWRDKQNNLHFQVDRAGKQYRVVVLEKENRLKVTEKSLGVISILSGMHVSTNGLPKSTVFIIWSVYAHAAVIVGLVSLVLSLYFWHKKTTLNKWQWISIGIVFVSSISYILFIWLIG